MFLTDTNSFTSKGDFKGGKGKEGGGEVGGGGGGGGLTDTGDVTLCRKSLHESCRMGRRIAVMKLTCSLGHCGCDGISLPPV